MESLSTHEQLAAITGKRVAQLSGPEAERRLRLATNMIQRLQAVVRLWLKRVRKRREGYKVTMRTELSYASSSPADRNQDKLRRIRVQQHGWRAPLSRRYQPLGEPRLELDRKPVQQAVAVHRHHRQTREEREHTFLGHGETMYGNVAKFGFAYFETYVVDAKASLLVTVEALGGDPDLFMSRTNAHPNVATSPLTLAITHTHISGLYVHCPQFQAVQNGHVMWLGSCPAGHERVRCCPTVGSTSSESVSSDSQESESESSPHSSSSSQSSSESDS